MAHVVFNTDGSGYWSTIAKPVTVTNMHLESFSDYDDDGDFGELRVYFDNSWDVYTDGLIYTDKQFIKDLYSFLKMHNLPSDDVYYSEQGMQGNNYVSLDAGDKFIKAWNKKFKIVS